MRRTPTETRIAAPRWLAGALLAGFLLGVAPAAAEPSPDRAQARLHFDRGVAFAKQQAYREALAEFQLAYAASPHFSVLYNIAQAELRLGRTSKALATFERYLHEGAEQIDATRRAEVEATLLREGENTGSLVLSIEPSGALVRVDDEPVGRAPLTAPLRVDPGVHRVVVSLDSGVSRQAEVQVAARRAIELRLELSPAPPAPAPVSAPPPPPAGAPPPPAAPPPPRRSVAPRSSTSPQSATPTRRVLGYVLGAAGAALAGAALGHYFWNRGRYEDWQARTSDYQREPTDENREAANELARSIPAASAVTVGLSVGAGVALSTGAVLLLTSPSPPSAAGALASGAQLTWRGQF